MDFDASPNFTRSYVLKAITVPPRLNHSTYVQSYSFGVSAHTGIANTEQNI